MELDVDWKICKPLGSCKTGIPEIQIGEEVTVTLKERDGWPATVKAKIKEIDPQHSQRVYTLTLDWDAVLEPPAGEDILALTPWCLCDKLRAHTIIKDNGDGSATVYNFDDSSTDVSSPGHEHEIDDVEGLEEALDEKASSSAVQEALNAKANKTVTITGGGIVSGGGDLSANRTLTVNEATDMEMVVGVGGSAVVTPRRLYTRLASWWDSIRSTVQTIIGQWTFSGEPRSTAALSGNGLQLITADQFASLSTARLGVLAGSEAAKHPENYPLQLAMTALAGRAAGVTGVSDEVIGGWIGTHNPALCSYSNLDGFYLNPSGNVGQCSGLSIQPPGGSNGMFRNEYGGRVNVACRLNGGNTTITSLDGRRFYFGLGTMTTGSGAALTKGPIGVGFGGASDYVQIWNGTDWQDTVLRWKDETSLLNYTWDFQIVSYGGKFTLYGRVASDTGDWVTLGTCIHNGYGLKSMVLSNTAEGPVLSPTNSNANMGILQLHYATSKH